MGARIPKGVLLVGPPGTGKTLHGARGRGRGGRAVFVHLGLGLCRALCRRRCARRVRDLFDQAKKVAPAIIFIDEIDAVGRQARQQVSAAATTSASRRSTSCSSKWTALRTTRASSSWRRPTAPTSSITRCCVLAALTGAMYVGACPTWRGREAHPEGPCPQDKPLGRRCGPRSASRAATAGFAGADLANLLNEAALLAAAQQAPRSSRMKDIGRGDAQGRRRPGEDAAASCPNVCAHACTAFHEAGHAIAIVLPAERRTPCTMITIIPRGAGGRLDRSAFRRTIRTLRLRERDV